MNTVPLLRVEADLVCELDGEPVTIRASGHEVVVNVRGWTSLMRLANLCRPLVQGSRRWIESAFQTSQTSVIFAINDRQVVRLGHGVNGGLLRFAGFPFRLYPLEIALTSFGRRNS